MACTGGCGEVYVDEYLNHPPINDPCGTCDTGCDSCGSGSCGANYVGATCQPSRPVLKRLAQFWGIQYVASDCGECGNAGCDGGGLGTFVSGHSGHSSSGCNCGESHSQAMMESEPTEIYEGSLQPMPQTRGNAMPEPIHSVPANPPANAAPAEQVQPQPAPAASTRGNRSTKTVSTRKPAPATTTTRKLAPTTTKSTSRLVPTP